MTFTNAAVWTMYYNLPYLPTVITTDTSGNQIFGAVNYAASPGYAGVVTVTFGEQVSGTMELR